MGLFGGSTDRGEMLALENRVARLEEQVARLSAALAARSSVPDTPIADLAAVPTSVPAAQPVEDSYVEARALAAAGNKIHAIKVVREQSGMSLKAAKDLVESW